MKQRHHNKRKKVSDLLFDLVKYLLTVIGVGAVLPESKLSTATVVAGSLITLVIFVGALYITPEERDQPWNPFLHYSQALRSWQWLPQSSSDTWIEKKQLDDNSFRFNRYVTVPYHGNHFLKLPEGVLITRRFCTDSLHLSTTAYIRHAIERMNRQPIAFLLEKTLAEASKKVSKDSLRVNREFAAFE